LIFASERDDIYPLLSMDAMPVNASISKDISENDYFGYYFPTYGSPLDMIRKYNISFISAAENLAATTSVERKGS